MIDWWGPILHEYYSGTESVGFTHISAPEWLARPGSVGRPYGCAVHIIGDDGAPLGPGETGTIFFEGKTGLHYHNDPAKTSQAHHANGWASMGDIGHVDADGYLFLTDRKAFTIISGGVNIYPSEIEAAFAAHAMVRDIAIFGIPDADLGEITFAVVELNEGYAADVANVSALMDHARATLAPFKLPRRMAFGGVGRTETGKVRKADLRAQYIDGTAGFATTDNVEISRISPAHHAVRREGEVHHI